jgi:hypothetical protein
MLSWGDLEGEKESKIKLADFANLFLRPPPFGCVFLFVRQANAPLYLK